MVWQQGWAQQWPKRPGEDNSHGPPMRRLGPEFTLRLSSVVGLSPGHSALMASEAG